MQSIHTHPEDQGRRLDAFLAGRHQSLSRSRWQTVIKAGLITVNGQARKANYILTGSDECICYDIPAFEPVELEPENIPLDILYEDQHLLALNKPAGMVVHPAPGTPRSTLVHAVLHHCPEVKQVGDAERPGIVHRLDKGTSGVMVVAKTEPARSGLVQQFKDRTMTKEYLALVLGIPSPQEKTITTEIGRHSKDRKKMSTESKHGKHAVTHYRVVQALNQASLLSLVIETGRTHQIRVHMSYIRHPVLGDRQYGVARHPLIPEGKISRQMLHAHILKLHHPITNDFLEFTAPMPNDMVCLMERLSKAETCE